MFNMLSKKAAISPQMIEGLIVTAAGGKSAWDLTKARLMDLANAIHNQDEAAAEPIISDLGLDSLAVLREFLDRCLYGDSDL
jgi:hypothetical protein